MEARSQGVQQPRGFIKQAKSGWLHGWETARHAVCNEVGEDSTDIGTVACVVAVALTALKTPVLSLKFRVVFL